MKISDKIFREQPSLLSTTFGYYKYFTLREKWKRFWRTGKWIKRAFVPGLVGKIKGRKATFMWYDEIPEDRDEH